jgi:hypothetical protein
VFADPVVATAILDRLLHHSHVLTKPAPRRPSMLDPYVARIEAWLAAKPHLTAVAIVDRLRECTPGRLGKKQLRTLQRFVKSWRAKTAKLLIDGVEAMIAMETPAAVPARTAAGVCGTIVDGAFGNP